MKEARFYSRREDGTVHCHLCPHQCIITGEKAGICGVRQNSGGTLFSLVWGRPVAVAVDPVEKKPLFHFHPGSPIYSIATVGCNFKCRHCQNADISQAADEVRAAGREIAPDEIVRRAVSAGCKSIAYTYTEPTIYYEYAFDISILARENGLKNVLVTNGYIEKEPLKDIAPHIDAANIDLKAFNEDFYRRVCGARLKPVLEAISLYREAGVWIEITTLVIPGLNDSDRELRSIARFIRDLGREIPWHVSRFHPHYRMSDRPATPLETVQRAWEIGKEEGLLYVYQGNVPGGQGESTACPSCRRTVIQRTNYRLGKYEIRKGHCSFCGVAVHGVGL